MHFLRNAFLCASVLLMVLLTGCTSNQYNVEADVTIGYDGVVKLSGGNPMTVSLKNYGEDLKGEIQVDIHTDNQRQITYAYPFEAAKGSENKIEMYLPLNMIQKKFDVRLVSGDDTVLSEEVTVDKFLAPDKPVIAVISDEPDRYRFLGEMAIQAYYYDLTFEENFHYSGTNPFYQNYGDNFIQVIYMDTMEAFEKTDALEFVNIVYVGNTQQMAMTGSVENNLSNWIAKGNLLLVEGGEDWKKTSSQLPQSLKAVELGPVQEKEFSGMASLEAPVTMEISGSTDKAPDAQAIILGQQVLGYDRPIGYGHAVILNYDPGDKGLVSVSSRILTELYEQIYSDYTWSERWDNDFSYDLRYIPVEKNPPFRLMAVVLIIYVLIVGPVVYVILKVRDKRDLMWVAVPAICLFFLGIMYVAGFRTSYSQPITNTESIISYKDGDAHFSIDSTIAVFNNDNRGMTVSWDDSQQLNMYGDDYYYHRYYDGNDTEEDHATTGKVYLGTTVTYESYDASLWEPMFMTGSKTLPVSQEKFQLGRASIYYDGDQVTVTNPTPFAIEYGFLKVGSLIYHVGHIGPGESLGAERTMYTDIYDYLDNHYGYGNRYDRRMSREDQTTYAKMDRLQDIYRWMDWDMNGSNIYTADTLSLYGINTDDAGYGIKVNGNEVDAYTTNVVKLDLAVELANTADITILYGDMYPDVILKTGNFTEEARIDYDKGNKTVYLYNVDEVNCTWQLADGLEVDKFDIKWGKIYTEENYYNHVYDKYGQAEMGKDPFGEAKEIFLYNYRDEVWDPVEEDEAVTDLDLSLYLNDDNEVRAMYRPGVIDDRREDYLLVVPEVRIEGRMGI